MNNMLLRELAFSLFLSLTVRKTRTLKGIATKFDPVQNVNISAPLSIQTILEWIWLEAV